MVTAGGKPTETLEGGRVSMTMNPLAQEIRGECPMCAADIIAAEGLEESEILTCPECQSKLVVDGRQGQSLFFSEAPAIEEDWGE